MVELLVMLAFYQREVVDIAEELGTDLSRGLSHKEAAERLLANGKNVLRAGKRDTLWNIILRQVSNPLSLVLIIAGLLTLILEKYSDFGVILAAALINILIGAFQEYKAERAFNSLKKAEAKVTTVFRDGGRKQVRAEDLVVGDLILLDAGSYIPADCRIVSQRDLFVNESVLTGEWAEVSKQTKPLAKKHIVPEETNMLFMGTLISAGTAKALVVATGESTELGKIAESLSNKREETPFQASIKKISNFLIFVIITLLAVVIVAGIIRGEPFVNLILVAVALAVAAIPEGLPIAVTVVLAMGMERILRMGGLVRNLLAAETLGSTTVILTDKTGTLTRAEMALEKIVTLSSMETGATSQAEEGEVLRMAILSSDAYIEGDEKSGRVVGRPVERAILSSGRDRDLHHRALLSNFPQEDFHAFASAHRFAASINSELGKKDVYLHVTGAPELVLDSSDRSMRAGKIVRLTKKDKDKLLLVQSEHAADGSRVLAIAYRKTENKNFPTDKKAVEQFVLDKLVFAGFLIIRDPIRKDAKEAVRKAKESHIRVIMTTGDQAPTAVAVAREVGIYKDGDQVLTGHQIETLSDEDLLRVIDSVSVFARTLPHQKLRLVDLLKKRGEVVAMTGDGTNDAPALHNAHIGIALGSGTEVAKESADLVLLDNSFSIIIAAIEEGRRILDNLRKIVAYLVSTGLTEIALVTVAILAGLPLPILAPQILWANIVGEGFMNFAFVFEPREPGAMRRDPRARGSRDILSRDVKKLMAVVASVTAILSLVLFVVLIRNNFEITETRTIMFAAVSISTVLYAFSLRDFKRPIWTIDLRSNKYLLISSVASIVLLALAIYLPSLANIIHVVPLSAIEAMGVLVFGIVNLLIIEAAKFAIFRQHSI